MMWISWDQNMFVSFDYVDWDLEQKKNDDCFDVSGVGNHVWVTPAGICVSCDGYKGTWTLEDAG